MQQQHSKQQQQGGEAHERQGSGLQQGDAGGSGGASDVLVPGVQPLVFQMGTLIDTTQAVSSLLCLDAFACAPICWCSQTLDMMPANKQAVAPSCSLCQHHFSAGRCTG